MVRVSACGGGGGERAILRAAEGGVSVGGAYQGLRNESASPLSDASV